MRQTERQNLRGLSNGSQTTEPGLWMEGKLVGQKLRDAALKPDQNDRLPVVDETSRSTLRRRKLSWSSV